MKLSVIFLCSVALGLPQLSYGMEEGVVSGAEDMMRVLEVSVKKLEEEKEKLLAERLGAGALRIRSNEGIDEKIQKLDATIKEKKLQIEQERKHLMQFEAPQEEEGVREAEGVPTEPKEAPRLELVTDKSKDGEKREKPYQLFPKLSENQQAGISLAMGASLLIAGYLYSKAPQWMKNRVKGILREHGKKLSDSTPAERDLLMAASYARFNPAGSLFFKNAVTRMPIDQEFSKELWPVLYHVYYGTKKTTRNQKRSLRSLYNDARENARTIAMIKGELE